LERITYYRVAASSPWAFGRLIGAKQRQIESDPKFEALVRQLNDESITHWLIFCEFKDTVSFLSELLSLKGKEIFTLTGDTPMRDRESVVESFRKAHEAIMIMTSVGSEGLDFQFCGGLVNYDLHWNPMKLEQRAGRIDRLGQEKATVKIINIHVANSIDDQVVSVMRRKLQAISNSIFAPSGAILGRTHRETRARLFNDETLTHELEAGDSLFETLRMNMLIETADYSVLQDVDTTLCDPIKLRREAQNLRSNSLVRSEVWLRQLRKDSETIQNSLKYFS